MKIIPALRKNGKSRIAMEIVERGLEREIIILEARMLGLCHIENKKEVVEIDWDMGRTIREVLIKMVAGELGLCYIENKKEIVGCDI